MGRVTINTGGTHSFVRESQNRRGDTSYRPYKLINNEKVFYETIHDITVYYNYDLGEKRYFGFVGGSKVYYDSDKAMSLLNETSNAEFKKWVHDQKKKRVAIESSMQYPKEKREAKHLKRKKTEKSQKSKSEEEHKETILEKTDWAEESKRIEKAKEAIGIGKLTDSFPSSPYSRPKQAARVRIDWGDTARRIKIILFAVACLSVGFLVLFRNPFDFPLSIQLVISLFLFAVGSVVFIKPRIIVLISKWIVGIIVSGIVLMLILNFLVPEESMNNQSNSGESYDSDFNGGYETSSATNVDASKETDTTLFNKSYEYEFEDKMYDFELELSRTKYNSYSSYEREYTYSGSLPSNWETSFYNMFVNRGNDDELIEKIIEKIRDNPEIKTDGGELKAVVSFVQTIPYDYDDYYSLTSNLNYPYETVYENKGVCSDVSVLLIKFLKELDYDVVGFVFDNANHMAVGVRCPSGYGNFGTDYCFIEPTGITRIGYVPEEYGIYGGIKLDKNPKVINFGGTRTYNGIIEDKKEEKRLIKAYGEDYLSMNNEQRKLSKKMTSLENKIDGLERQYKLKGCEGVIYIGTAKERTCDRLYNELNGYIDDYNELVEEFNNLN